MDSDIVSLYLIRKKDNICWYANEFLKYTIKTESNLNNILSKIVEIYIENYYLDNNNNYDILDKYFETDNKKETLMKSVLASALLFYTNSGLEAQIKKDINTIVLLSNAIYLSINFDNCINEYKNSALDLDIRFNNFFDEFSTKLKINEDDIVELKNILLNRVKKDINCEKKFWKSLDDSNYCLNFKDSLNNSNIFLTTYYNDIKLLNRYDKEEVERISKTKGIYDDILSIYIQKLSIVVLKDLLCNNLEDRFIINIDKEFFNKIKNLNTLENMLGNSLIKNRIIFNFDFNNISEHLNIIDYLNENNYLCSIQNITESNLNTSIIEKFNYIFIDSELLNKYKDYKEIWSIKGIQFITDINSFRETTEDYILRENR